MKPRITDPLVADPGGGGGLSPATAEALGGVKAEPATEADTQPVRIGDDDKLYTEPYNLPAGTSAALGGAKFDQAVIGSTLQVGINADSQAVVPVASQQHLGVVTGKAKTTETGEVAVDLSGKMWVKEAPTRQKYHVEIVPRNRHIPLDVLAGTVSRPTSAPFNPGLTFTDKSVALFEREYVLPLGENDSWTLTADFVCVPAASGSPTPLVVTYHGGNYGYMPQDIASGLGFTFGLSGGSKTYRFEAYYNSGDEPSQLPIGDNHRIVQLRFDGGVFSFRCGAPSSEHYIDGTTATNVHVSWSSWKEVNHQTLAFTDVAGIATSDFDIANVNRAAIDVATFMNAGMRMVWDAIGCLTNPTYRYFKGTIYSITADVETAVGYDAHTNGDMATRDIRFLGSSVFNSAYFTPFISQQFGNEIMQKEAVGGTTLAVRDGYTDSYVERYENFTDKDKAEALVIQLSTNDFTLECDPGEVSANSAESLIANDGAGLDTGTTTGALEYLFAHAKHANPDVKIMVVPCPVLSGWAKYGDYGTFIGGKLKDLRDKWGITVCDLYNNTATDYGYNAHPSFLAKNTTAFWTSDSGATNRLFNDAIHMTQLGYETVFTPGVGSDIVRMFNN